MIERAKARGAREKKKIVSRGRHRFTCLPNFCSSIARLAQSLLGAFRQISAIHCDHGRTDALCVRWRTDRPRAALEVSSEALDENVAGCRLFLFNLDLHLLVVHLLLAPPHGQARPANEERKDLQGHQRRLEATQVKRDGLALGPDVERRCPSDPSSSAAAEDEKEPRGKVREQKDRVNAAAPPRASFSSFTLFSPVN